MAEFSRDVSMVTGELELTHIKTYIGKPHGVDDSVPETVVHILGRNGDLLQYPCTGPNRNALTDLFPVGVINTQRGEEEPSDIMSQICGSERFDINQVVMVPLRNATVVFGESTVKIDDGELPEESNE